LHSVDARESFTAKHVRQVFEDEFKHALFTRMPVRYLQLEQERLTRLVSTWLDYEVTRIPFHVLETEAKRTVVIAGLTFDLRLDRIDRLNDDSLLVIDYKTGDLKPKVWELPRPEDIQLPLYASFGIAEGASLGGLAFAKIRPGNIEFSGHLRSASTTLFSALNGTSALVKRPVRPDQLSAWREEIEKLARDFLAGRAEVDPREYPKTCERCGLQSLCRVNESKTPPDGGAEPGEIDGFAEMVDA
jgi:ATP-dependent helicase/DNAse subunit B